MVILKKESDQKIYSAASITSHKKHATLPNLPRKCHSSLELRTVLKPNSNRNRYRRPMSANGRKCCENYQIIQNRDHQDPGKYYLAVLVARVAPTMKFGSDPVQRETP